MTMKGTQDLVFAIRAGYSFFYAESYEINKVHDELVEVLQAYTNSKGETPYKGLVQTWDFEIHRDPEKVLEMLEDVDENRRDKVPPGTIVIAKNLDLFMNDEYGNPNKQLAVFLQNRAQIFSDPDYDKTLIVLGNNPFEKAVPDLIKRDFLRIEFPLPNEAEILELYDFIADSAGEKFIHPDEKTKQQIIDSCKGLTAREITNILSYSYIKDAGTINPLTVAEKQAEEIASTPGLKIGIYDVTLDDLKGLDEMKEMAIDSIGDNDAKGMLVCGVAGVGKTHFGQAIAGAVKQKIIEMEPAQLEGEGLVGQKENAWKKALDVIKANAPCILFIDEIEKGLAGVGGGATTGDTSTKKAASQLLKFLSGDCAPFFCDLPSDEIKQEIFDHYMEVFNQKLKDEGSDFVITGKPTDTAGWSGAELKSLVRQAKIRKRSINEVEHLIIPISVTMEAEIKALRQVSGKAMIPADKIEKKAPVRRKAKSRKLDA